VAVHVREMPFFDTKRGASILGVNVEVLAYEPVVWVSVTRPEIAVLPLNAPKFPAIVDTGNTLAFNTREDQLTACTGLKAISLPPAPPLKVTDASGSIVRLPRRQAKVWLHPYPEGTGLMPRDLQIAGGILVYESLQPTQLIGPHLPLLGARAFFPTKLAVFIDYKRLQVTIGDEDRLP
jgi:hypothetical protein